MLEYRYSVTTEAGVLLRFTSPRPNQQWAMVRVEPASTGVVYDHSSNRATMVKRLTKLEDDNAVIQDKYRSRWELHRVDYHPREVTQFFLPADLSLRGVTARQWLQGDPTNYVTVDTTGWTFAMWECAKNNDESWWWGFTQLRHFITGDHYFSEGSTGCITCNLKPSQLPSITESTKED